MTVLAEKGGHDFDLENILVEVHASVDNQDKSSVDLFTEINKAEPVKLVDMPGLATKKEQRIINDAAEKLRDDFPDMFKASQQCRSPHLNIDNLRDALFRAEILKRQNLSSPKQLFQWLLEQNNRAAEKFEKEDEMAKVGAKALEKAKANNFYLGLDSSWLIH